VVIRGVDRGVAEAEASGTLAGNVSGVDQCRFALRGRAGRGSLVVADGVVDIADGQRRELPSDPMEPFRR
jgi:hypothetical protein